MAYNRLHIYHPIESRSGNGHRVSFTRRDSASSLAARAHPNTRPWPRYRSILVPLDGTAFAEHAIPYAIGLAERSGASLKLVHVHSVFEGMKDSWPLYFNNMAVERQKRRKESYLDRVRRQISNLTSVRVHSSVITGPDVADALDSVEWLEADIVIMATHARGPIGRFCLGDVVHRLLRMTDLPVMLVPGNDTAVRFAAKSVRHIVIPLDGTAAAERALKPATAFGGIVRTKYTLMQAVPLEPNHVIRFGALRTDWVPSDERERHSSKYLQSHAHLMRLRGYNVRTSVVSSDDPIADTIRQFEKRSKADLIAVTTRRRNILSRVLWPNTAEELIRGARVPVLVVPSDRTTRERQERSFEPFGRQQ